jgi:transmembrane sensor
LEFEGTELAEAIALLNRHNRLQIALGDPALGRLRISGVFRADNPEGFVRIAEQALNLRVEFRRSGEVVLYGGVTK